MSSLRDGIPLAGFTTFMNLWVALTYGPQLWQWWGGSPIAKVGLLLVAGGSASTLMNVWSLVIGKPSPGPRGTLPLTTLPTEPADV